MNVRDHRLERVNAYSNSARDIDLILSLSFILPEELERRGSDDVVDVDILAQRFVESSWV